MHYGRDTDFDVPGLDDLVLPGQRRIEDRGVGGNKRTGLVVGGSGEGDQLQDAQLEIVRAETDRPIADPLQPFNGHLELDFRLPAGAAHLIADIQRDDVPAAALQFLHQRMPARQAALLVHQPGAAARFDVTVLFARDQRALPAVWANPQRV